MMRKRHFRLILLVFCSILLQVEATNAKREYTKTIEQSFSITEDGTVDLENLHGDIDISTWAKNEVEIKVTIRIFANSDRRAESTFERIQIDFSNDDNFVKAETEISSANSTWWFVRSWWGDADIAINYEVFMPESCNLEVSNQYGNIDVENIFGSARIELKHGTMEMDHAATTLHLNIAYGNGTIAKTNQAIVDLAYSKLRINDANTVDIDSKFSKVTIESANEIDSDSNYDGYKIGDVGVFHNDGKLDQIEIDKAERVTIETNNTDIDIDLLVFSCNADLRHGSLKIDRVSRELEEIRVDSRYVGINIDLGELSQYRLMIDGNYTSVKLPDGIRLLKEDKDDHHLELEGYLGAEAALAAVSIESEYGGIRIY